MIKNPNIEDALNATYKFWEIDDNGNIIRLHQESYIIEKDRLTELNWLNHILNKYDENAGNEFYFVFMEALKKAGYKTLTIDLEDSLNKITATK